jgi:hypothetical protein
MTVSRPAVRMPGRTGLTELRTGISRRTWAGLGIALGLWWVFMHYTRWPSVQKKADIVTILTQGAPNTFGEFVSREGWPYWLSWIPTGVNMNENNAIGMAFAFLIGGAVSALVLPEALIRRVIASAGARGAAFGGMLGAPLLMCSACSVPVALGWRRRGASYETTLAVVLGAGLLNLVGLLTIAALFPAPVAWGRIVASIGMVLIVVPITVGLVRRVTKPGDATGLHVPHTDKPLEVAAGRPVNESWPAAVAGAVRAWWRASVAVAYRLWIPMTAATFLAAFIRLFVPPEVVTRYLGAGPPAIALAALIGTAIAIPTLF